MGKDCRSPLHQQYSPLEFPNFTSSVPYSRQQMFSQSFANSYNCMVSENGSVPGMAIPWLPHFKRSHENGEMYRKDFHQSPRAYTCRTYANGSLPGSVVPELPYSKTFRGMEKQERYFHVPNLCESETPLPDSVLDEKLYSPNKFGIEASSYIVSGPVQKAFLVIDKGTNLIFSSLVPSPAQKPNLANASPIDTCKSEQKDSQATRALISHPWPIIYEGLDENRKITEESEMHEDTEELDALLYSDYSECQEEETSTAHSPGEIPGQCEIVESTDEVTSPVGGATKRKRLCDEEEELLSDTGSSTKASKYENDAESGCQNERSYGKLYASEASKRVKRERILDTMSILQSIVPGGKGGDSALILDEAIKYLRFLKRKAKSLGVAME